VQGLAFWVLLGNAKSTSPQAKNRRGKRTNFRNRQLGWQSYLPHPNPLPPGERGRNPQSLTGKIVRKPLVNQTFKA